MGNSHHFCMCNLSSREYCVFYYIPNLHQAGIFTYRIFHCLKHEEYFPAKNAVYLKRIKNILAIFGFHVNFIMAVSIII